MDYKKINTYLGWLIFIIATTVYFMTLEDSVSLWDCGEYVTAAYKLEVGHPPGAPLFMVFGRLASFFADPESVAIWINRLSALSSSATILFMFWSITLLVKKMILRTKEELENGDKIAIFGSAVVGSLAYTFSESFWFSAVEGEVYAMSSLFTAVIFWAALKWDEEMINVQKGKLVPKSVSPDRWMLLIMFMLGLAVGVHLLGILVVPAIAYIVYFRYNGISSKFFQIYIGVAIFSVVVGIFKMGISGGDVAGEIVKQGLVLGVLYGLFIWSKTQKIIEFLLVGLMSIVLLSFIQDGVITGSVSFAAFLEISLVTSVGLPFYTGTILFFLILIGLFVYMLRRSRKSGNRAVYSAVMGLLLLLIGYGSFAVIVIRSNANTPLDENDPENLVTLHSYLKREQYGSAPLAVGHYWNSRESGGQFVDVGNGQQQWNAGYNRENWDDQSPVHLRRFVVKQGDDVVRAFQEEARAKEYISKNKGGLTIEETYFVSNESSREGAIPTYSQTTVFPRMYWSAEPSRIDSYKEWSGYDENDDKTTEIGKDGKRIPTMGENLQFFFRYQVNWMYWRYFFWNFSGRQNDIQGSRGGAMRGNWLSGYSIVDDARLGNQEAAPYYTKENKSNNNFFLLPLVLGLIGLFFHAYRSPKQAFVLFLAFLFTGLAIVVYLNQKPLEPRERDYAYAGSFYFFAMWIGIGVYGMYETFRNISKDTLKKLGYAAGGGLLLFLMLDMSSVVGMPATMSWLIVLLLAAVFLGIMFAAKKVTQKNTHGAALASLLALFVPILMGMEGWDDHDRSNKTSAHDLAYNYLVSCGPNGIIFTNGDNDTFPLWYMQEVEEKFTDRRVCNLSLMQTDWYTNQMKMKAYGSEPLPIKFTEDQILMNYGGTDQIFFKRLIDLMRDDFGNEQIVKKMLALRIKQNPEMAMQKTRNLVQAIPQILAGAQAKTPALERQIRKYIAIAQKPLKKDKDTTEWVYEKLAVGMRIYNDMDAGSIQLDQSKFSLFNQHVFRFEDGWDITSLPDAMAFVRDDANMIPLDRGGDLYRFFPSSGFAMDVNEDNLVKSGLVSKDELKDCVKSIRFRFRYSTEQNPNRPSYTVEGIPMSRARSLTKSYLRKEQVMMLDIIANNDWKRPLYFSSPSGSEVASAILHGYSGNFDDGAIKQNGMAFELTPLNGTPGINRDRMYDNLMNKYHYGDMKNPDVLTDYYTRRHTVQYRSHFMRLASSYMREVEYAEAVKKNNPNATGLPSDKEVKEYKNKAVKLLKKSLEVMPADIVIDHSEPTATGEGYLVGGKTRRGFTDGVLHDYVDLLYAAGDKNTARKLAKTLATQYESIFEYYAKSDARITSQRHNVKDLYAALESYFVVYGAVSNEDSGSDLDRRMFKKLSDVYSQTIPKMVDDLSEAAENNGESMSRESSQTGMYAQRAFDLIDFTDGIAYRVGFKEIPQEPQPTQQPARTAPAGGQPVPGGNAPVPANGQPQGGIQMQPQVP